MEDISVLPVLPSFGRNKNLHFKPGRPLVTGKGGGENLARAGLFALKYLVDKEIRTSQAVLDIQ